RRTVVRVRRRVAASAPGPFPPRSDVSMFPFRWPRFAHLRLSGQPHGSHGSASPPRRTRARCAPTPLLEALEDRTAPAVFTVNNVNDSGPGSLRQAVLDANATTGPNTITFNISGAGTQTIQPASALPALTGNVVIDGTTQPTYTGTPLIDLNGSA